MVALMASGGNGCAGGSGGQVAVAAMTRDCSGGNDSEMARGGPWTGTSGCQSTPLMASGGNGCGGGSGRQVAVAAMVEWMSYSP